TAEGGKAARRPLSRRLRTVLAELREVTAGNPWLLPRSSGANTTDRALVNRIRDLRVRAGIPCCGPHRIRHSVLTLAARAGATPYALQKWARHSAMKTTMDYYVHLDNGLAAEAIACVAGPTAVSTSGNAPVTGGNTR